MVNELAGKQNDKNSLIPCLTYQRNKITNPEQISNIFNNHFAEAGMNVVDNLVKTSEKPKRFIKQ